jgi:predicted RNA binding protein YcfA (HicA-like mRNA interferase family)
VKVRDKIKLIEINGWRLARQHGTSHRQYHHAERPGTVTIAGKPGDDVPEKTLSSILKQARLTRKDLR